MPSRTPRVPSIGLNSRKSSICANTCATGKSIDSARFPMSSRAFRQEFVQGRIKQTNTHGCVAHQREYIVKILLLYGAEQIQRRQSRGIRGGKNQLTHHGLTAVFQKHMLCANQAEPIYAKGFGQSHLLRCVGVASHAQSAKFIGPRHKFVKRTAQFGFYQRWSITEYLARAALYR